MKQSLTFVGDVDVVGNKHQSGHVISVVEDARLLLEHDLHLVDQLFHDASDDGGRQSRIRDKVQERCRRV